MIGYWADHKYERRSVEKDVTRFVGFKKLGDLIEKVPEYNYPRNQALFATIFLTGGRICEVLDLTKKNFAVKNDEVIVTDMPLEKRYKKEEMFLEHVIKKPSNALKRLFKDEPDGSGRFFRQRYKTTKKFEVRREFRFSVEEPFADILLSWLDKTDNYLFSGYNPRMSYITAYRVICETGFYPHWLRGQRASCLITEYGWRMEMMMEWMGWEELTTARHYAKFGPSELVAGKKLK